jgi:dihydrofolate reductase
VSTDWKETIVSVIVTEFITLDGVVSDPVGRDGTTGGGWAFRHGPEAIAGDPFRVGGVVENGVLLLGRKTWQLFSGIWPGRDDPFSQRMNAAAKLVASRTLTDASVWPNSETVADAIDAVKREQRDVVVMGSLGIAHRLITQDLVDEYRLMTFPTIVGTGERLFPAGGPPAHLECVSAEQSGPAVVARYKRAAP